nr:hypothetical protein [Lactobacillus delbrueckii]
MEETWLEKETVDRLASRLSLMVVTDLLLPVSINVVQFQFPQGKLILIGTETDYKARLAQRLITKPGVKVLPPPAITTENFLSDINQLLLTKDIVSSHGAFQAP